MNYREIFSQTTPFMDDRIFKDPKVLYKLKTCRRTSDVYLYVDWK